MRKFFYGLLLWGFAVAVYGIGLGQATAPAGAPLPSTASAVSIASILFCIYIKLLIISLLII